MAKPTDPKKKKRRQYDNPFPSVTQVLDVLRKAGLEHWFKVNTPQFIQEESNKGKEIGTQIHDAIQAHIELRDVKIETDYAVEVKNAITSFMLFKKENPDIILHKSEMILTHGFLKYNGTLDVVAELMGVPVIGDWKTGKAGDYPKPKIYDEHKAQLAAYIKAYNWVMSQADPQFVDIKKGFIVVMAKDKVAYDYYIMDSAEIEAEFFGVFVPALTISNHQRRNVIANYYAKEAKSANIGKIAV